MLIRHSWKLTLAIALVLPATVPTTVQAEPRAKSAETGESAPAVRVIKGVNLRAGTGKANPAHPMAGKLQEQIDRSVEQSRRITVHAERLERAIRRSANARLFAESLGRELSQNPSLGKERRSVLGRALMRASEESLPIHERRKKHKEAQLNILRSAGIGAELQIPPALVGEFRQHNQRVAMLHRILFIAAQAGDYKSVGKAEKLLAETNSQFFKTLQAFANSQDSSQ